MVGEVAGGLTLRKTVADDEEFLWEMLFYASHSNDETGVTPEDIRANPDLIGYIEGWRDAGRCGVVAELDGDPIGAAWLRAFNEADRTNPVYVDGTTPELAIAVVPGHEGRGIGTAMIEALVAEARGRFPAIVLSSRVENPAVSLYERLGFRIVEELINRVGTRSVKMVVDL